MKVSWFSCNCVFDHASFKLVEDEMRVYRFFQGHFEFHWCDVILDFDLREKLTNHYERELLTFCA